MKTKQKLSLRRIGGVGMVVVFTVLLICIFFSGTMRTLTTAKIRVTTVSSGKLKDNIQITGYLHFDENEEIFSPEMPEGVNVVVGKVYVWMGQTVTQGTPLFTVRATNLNELKTDLLTRWQTNETQLLLRMRTPEKTTRNDVRWFAAYTELMKAKGALLALEEDSPEYDVVEEQIAEAQTKYDSANRYPISDAAFTWFSEMEDLRKQNASLESRLAVLKSVPEEITVIAPHDGIILSVNIEEGNMINRESAAIVISTEQGEAVLRGTIDMHDRQVAAGMKATVEITGGNTIRSSVLQTGYDRSSTPWVDVTLNQEDIMRFGGAVDLMSSGARITIAYSAKEISLLIPVAALRGNIGDYYVYTVNESEDVFGSKVLHLSKQTVTLIDQSDDTAAISGISPNTPIAYMEDRALADGAEVLIYGSVP